MSASLSAGQAMLLGAIQGLTEFLPVSSSGHLALAEAYLRIQGGSLAVIVLLHVGTLLAILFVFQRGWRNLLAGAWELVRHPLAGPRRWSENAILAAQVTCATIPGALAGAFLEQRVESAFGDPRLIGGLLLVTALLLFATRKTSPGTALGWKAAWIIGLVQACAILPGISRSGSTIATALLIGVARPDAAEFSFLAAIPLILGSLLMSLPSLESSAAHGGAGVLVLGFLTSFVVGWAALVWLIRVVRRGQLHWFGFYCAAVGLAVLVWPPV
jgi:undecaprenyl-diphosphatase